MTKQSVNEDDAKESQLSVAALQKMRDGSWIAGIL
jgi:hypothetical protein